MPFSARVRRVGAFIGCGRHPRLLNLEIMREVHQSPSAIVIADGFGSGCVAGMKAPTEIKELARAWLGTRAGGNSKGKGEE